MSIKHILWSKYGRWQQLLFLLNRKWKNNCHFYITKKTFYLYLVFCAMVNVLIIPWNHYHLTVLDLQLFIIFLNKLLLVSSFEWFVRKENYIEKQRRPAISSIFRLFSKNDNKYFYLIVILLYVVYRTMFIIINNLYREYSRLYIYEFINHIVVYYLYIIKCISSMVIFMLKFSMIFDIDQWSFYKYLALSVVFSWY